MPRLGNATSTLHMPSAATYLKVFHYPSIQMGIHNAIRRVENFNWSRALAVWYKASG